MIASAPARRAAPRFSLFQLSLAASFGAHALVWGVLSRPAAVVQDEVPNILDVDVRTPFRPRDPKDKRLPGAAKGAPAPAELKVPAPVAPSPVPVIPAPVPQPAAPDMEAAPSSEKPKDWVLPGPDTRKLEKPTLDSAAPAGPVFTAPGGTGPGGQNGLGGSGGGRGTGDAIVNRRPRLLNRDELLGHMQRFYPDVERRIGREGRVFVSVTIEEDGRVSGVDVLASAGEAFDDAARRVARLMRFEPELKASVPVRSTLKLPVVFQLRD